MSSNLKEKTSPDLERLKDLIASIHTTHGGVSTDAIVLTEDWSLTIKHVLDAVELFDRVFKTNVPAIDPPNMFRKAANTGHCWLEYCASWHVSIHILTCRELLSTIQAQFRDDQGKGAILRDADKIHDRICSVEKAEQRYATHIGRARMDEDWRFIPPPVTVLKMSVDNREVVWEIVQAAIMLFEAIQLVYQRLKRNCLRSMRSTNW